MTRLQDKYEHLLLDAMDHDQKPYETYDDWMMRIGVNEADDDAGVYGDDCPSWSDADIRPLPLE
jgi:hypothetical protein